VVEASTRLGRHRWKVERALAWLLANRRLTVRYERRADLLILQPHLFGLWLCARRPGTWKAVSFECATDRSSPTLVRAASRCSTLFAEAPAPGPPSGLTPFDAWHGSRVLLPVPVFGTAATALTACFS
jgi:hypothetical protein